MKGNRIRGPVVLELPLNHIRIRESLKKSLKKWVKNHKKAALLLGSLPGTVPLFYFADVWAFGSLAAALHDVQLKLATISIFASPDQKTAAHAQAMMLPYITRHPVATGWAWLTRPSASLSHPEVKNIWQWLNLAIFTVGSIGLIIRRVKGGGGKNNNKFVHGLEIVDNSAYGTSRWAGLKDLQEFCEYGPPKEVIVPTVETSIS